MTAPTDAHRAFVPLLPQFLRSWSRGWGGMPALLAEIGLTTPQFFLLRALVQEADPGGGMTEADIAASIGNPYQTVRPELAHLPTLVDAGYVSHDAGNRYTVTPEGHAAVRRVETAKNAYLATVQPAGVAPEDLTRLVETLHDLGERLWAAPEPWNKAHQARIRRTPAPPDAAPLVRLLDAVYALWYARDDAHIAAWQEAGFAAPVFDLLTHLWEGKADTQSALAAAVAERQTAESVAAGLRFLAAAGYIEWQGDAVRLVPFGQQVRVLIEDETDRIYFAPWPPDTDIAWLHDTLAAVIAGMPVP